MINRQLKQKTKVDAKPKSKNKKSPTAHSQTVVLNYGRPKLNKEFDSHNPTNLWGEKAHGLYRL